MKEHEVRLRPDPSQIACPGRDQTNVMTCEGGETGAARPLRSTSAEQSREAGGSVCIMEIDDLPAKSRGRLTRETLDKLGKTLEAYYDDVRKEGVPDRFKDLLQQLERPPRTKEST